MRRKEARLLVLLARQTQPVSSFYIAKQLDISKNSVKNLIYKMNDQSKDKIIDSSRAGYWLNEYGMTMLSNEKSSIPQTYIERAFFIIRTVMLKKTSQDIYEIADELFVSYSTLKNTLQRMNKTFERFQVRFLSKKDNIIIQGEEEDLRRLAAYAVSEETNWQFLDLAPIKETFGHAFVEKTEEIIRLNFKKYHAYLNDFAFMNLLLHLLILIERVEKGNHIEETSGLDKRKNNEDTNKLIVALWEEFEATFSISLNQGDKDEIAYFVLTTASQVNEVSFKEIVGAVEKKLLEDVQQIANEVNEIYRINLINPYFLSQFSLHVHGLIQRATNKRYNRNPLLENIKVDCRMIFDIAVFFSLRIEGIYHIDVVEDEIAYIAIHLASEIERQKVNEEKIQAVLFTPNYNFHASSVEQQLVAIVNNDVHIKAVISQIEELDNYQFDLLFTTVDISLSGPYTIIRIPMFINSENRNIILQRLTVFQRNQKRKILLENFNKYFSEDLFYSDLVFKNKMDLIHQLCETMEEKGVVQENFETSVLQRENAASTAFSNIAIPHSLQMDAIKTSIAVVISKKGIEWDDERVHVVLLFAVNYVDRHYFSQIYESLIHIFDHPQIINKISKLRSLADVRQLIENEKFSI
ncbi:PTS sugar transporter subunit IIA [Enterococcus sp. ALS3]|uniref:PTS sugar transporter subunit IIA n=1 Tax=Enterococcus alishanensis TaxID=1303817 RepID=A0ABS6TFS9_9ENTE|nr:PTS sugar transporter subunit IIA [Enterococcus alishanensis]MBV7391789.1 PTS sugar transporter subunit IIA [Enterococcus alishanensis]